MIGGKVERAPHDDEEPLTRAHISQDGRVHADRAVTARLDTCINIGMPAILTIDFFLSRPVSVQRHWYGLTFDVRSTVATCSQRTLSYCQNATKPNGDSVSTIYN